MVYEVRSLSELTFHFVCDDKLFYKSAMNFSEVIFDYIGPFHYTYSKGEIIFGVFKESLASEQLKDKQWVAISTHKSRESLLKPRDFFVGLGNVTRSLFLSWP